MAEARAAHQHRQQVSLLTSLIRWLQLKNYQYEVTFSLYMLTYTEKIVFNSILVTLISLLITAAYLYLPAHIIVIYTRVWYYISGEFTQNNGGGMSMLDSITEALKATKEVVVSQTVSSAVAKETLGRAGSVVGVVRDEL
ncbi:hypothetical protein PMZ80_006003 [Knufia obscura]|uniref:Uncharacterized protein n=2 Tax=Knufia TaxID=430999 RepID=A0AAN8FAM7_9EURO|nr:hypothetical protein PMZ80_006003 [Knufia obscura]KAK5954671.1 hypothetical protein OHC33_004395 [Knufia fluminis]